VPSPRRSSKSRPKIASASSKPQDIVPLDRKML
jgi:hypothetical protein